MKIRLQDLLSWLTVITAVAYAIGWLKTFYYFDAFGIGVSALGLSVSDYLFESWFVLENIVFVLLLAWFVVKTNYRWAWILLAVVALTPVASHYAFAFADNRLAQILINYRHTVMKFIPLGAYTIGLLHGPTRQRLRNLSWPHGQAGLAYGAILLMAWSISAAKHFGSFDANRAQLWPENYLPHIVLHSKNEAADASAGSDSYLLYATAQNYFIWNRTDFKFGVPEEHIKVVVVPKDQVTWIETQKNFQIQPGSLFF